MVPSSSRPIVIDEPPLNDVSSVDVLLEHMREQLEMDVAFVTRFDGAHREFRNIQAVIDTAPIRPGYKDDLGGTFCHYIVEGLIGEVVRDAQSEELLHDLPETQIFGIRSYAGVPLVESDGSVYGTLCAFSQTVDNALTDRDSLVLHVLAPVLMGLIREEDSERASRTAKVDALHGLSARGGLQPVFQPIVSLVTKDVVGWEALSRFPSATAGPAEWFAMADEVGLLIELERDAISAAIRLFDAQKGFLSVNVSEDTFVSADFVELFGTLPLNRVMLEITEHKEIKDFIGFHAALKDVRRQGAQLAIDDTGAGYSTLQQVLELEPEVIKLDIGMIRSIDTDRRRQAMAAAMAAFAIETGSTVLAEGIETADELQCLQDIGIGLGQGYHLAPPAPHLLASLSA